MLEYIVLGTGSIAVYATYCNYSFYKVLKKTIIKKLAETNDRYKTLEQVFTDNGVHLYNAIQPKSGIPPRGDLGTVFLKPTIHLAKIRLLNGAYDNKSRDTIKN